MMTEVEIAEALKLCESATPSEWVHDGELSIDLTDDRSTTIAVVTGAPSNPMSQADAAFIAAARTGWPRALDDLREAQVQLAHEENAGRMRDAHAAKIESALAAAQAEVERLTQDLNAERGWRRRLDHAYGRAMNAARLCAESFDAETQSAQRAQAMRWCAAAESREADEHAREEIARADAAESALAAAREEIAKLRAVADAALEYRGGSSTLLGFESSALRLDAALAVLLAPEAKCATCDGSRVVGADGRSAFIGSPCPDCSGGAR